MKTFPWNDVESDIHSTLKEFFGETIFLLKSCFTMSECYKFLRDPQGIAIYINLLSIPDETIFQLTSVFSKLEVFENLCGVYAESAIYSNLGQKIVVTQSFN